MKTNPQNRDNNHKPEALRHNERMKVARRNIDEWVERFMNGETTNEEEQAIYRFFRSGNVPKHLREQIRMFAWYEAGMPGKPEDFPMPKEKRHIHIPLVVWSAGIAASVVIVLGLGWMAWDKYKEMSAEWKCYEGSYVVINGKRIADVKRIMPYIQETLEEADRMEKCLAEQDVTFYAITEEDLEQELMDDVPDEEMRQAIQEALK